MNPTQARDLMRNNLPAGQQRTQRLVDQFNADEQNWRDTLKMVEAPCNAARKRKRKRKSKRASAMQQDRS